MFINFDRFCVSFPKSGHDDDLKKLESISETDNFR